MWLVDVSVAIHIFTNSSYAEGRNWNEMKSTKNHKATTCNLQRLFIIDHGYVVRKKIEKNPTGYRKPVITFMCYLLGKIKTFFCSVKSGFYQLLCLTQTFQLDSIYIFAHFQMFVMRRLLSVLTMYFISTNAFKYPGNHINIQFFWVSRTRMNLKVNDAKTFSAWISERRERTVCPEAFNLSLLEHTNLLHGFQPGIL